MLSNEFLEDKLIFDFLPIQNKIKNNLESNLDAFIASETPVPLQILLRNALFPGRRLRPTLLYLLTGNNISSSNEFIINQLSLALELCHRSSIIIDDLIDGDDLRRQFSSFHKKYGLNTTILLSHYLVAQVFSLVQKLPPEYRSLTAEYFSTSYLITARGEMADIGLIKNHSNYVSFYNNYVLGKTSGLFELTFKLAAVFNNQRNQITLMGAIGKTIGKLYQVYNDLYDDVFATLQDRGNKNKWLINYTLLNCFLLDNGTSAQRRFIKKTIGKKVSLSATRQLQSFFQTESILPFFQEYSTTLFDELKASLEIVNDVHINQITINFYNWLKQKKCWNQLEYANAGY